MSRTLNYTIIVVFGATLLIISAARPDWLGDQNLFLKQFVNHELLNVLGVILAITLASTANIHLAFNRIEEAWKAPGALNRSRFTIKKAAYWLIGLFCVAVITVVIKPIASVGSTSEAMFNSVALVILLWHVLLLVNLTDLVFAIKPNFPPSDDVADGDDQAKDG